MRSEDSDSEEERYQRISRFNLSFLELFFLKSDLPKISKNIHFE